MTNMTWQREPAFNVGVITLHVETMFGEYRRGIVACMYFSFTSSPTDTHNTVADLERREVWIPQIIK
jgi:hypothetical protein